MPIGFPSSPTTGQQWPTVNPRWEWDGAKWVALPPGTPVTLRYTSLLLTDDFIALRSGVPGLVSTDVMADTFGGEPPAATAPAVMTVGQWTVVPITGGLRFDIDAAPSDGGSPITGYQYSTNNGATWTAFSGGAALGPRDITGLAATPLQNRVRAVNAVNPAPDPGSDTKTETPGASGGGGGALTIVRATPYQTTWDTNHTISFPAVAPGNSLIIACVGVRDDARMTGLTPDHTGGAHNDGQFVTFWHIDNVTDSRTSVTITTYNAGSPASGGLRAIVLEVNASAIAPASTYAPQETTSTTSFSHGFTTTAAGAAAVSLINAPGGPVLTGTGGWTAAWATGEWDNIMYAGDLGAAGAKAVTGGLSPSGNVRTNTLAYAAV